MVLVTVDKMDRAVQLGMVVTLALPEVVSMEMAKTVEAIVVLQLAAILT